MREFLTSWSLRLRALFTRRHDHVREELELHIELLTAQHRAAGLAPDAARAAAHRQFGNLTSIQERSHDLFAFRLLEDMVTDIRLASRGVRRTPAFALVAVLSMAVGIGVNTALATIVEEVWLKPVPGVAEQATLVETVATESGNEVAYWSYPDFEDVRRVATAFDALAASADGAVSLMANERSERVGVKYVSANFFRILGVVMARGRGFLASEDSGAGQHPVVVVSHDMWQNRLGGEENILGLTVSLNRSPYTVVGVAPEEFTGARPLSGAIDLWVPLMQHPSTGEPGSLLRDREARWLRVIGRLEPDATFGQTNAALRTVFAGLEAQYPETNGERSALVRSFGRFPAQNRAGDMAAVFGLLVLVGLVLLIICGNVAGMMLAKNATREREIAVRLALGSGRSRVVRQLMVEALVLAVAGGAVGTLVGFWLTSFATPERLGVAMIDLEFQPSAAVLLFSVGLTAAATVVVGLFPALRFSRPELVSSLKDDAGCGGKRVGRLHRVAASAQVGIALGFLVTCSLFVRATGLVDEQGFGFDPDKLVLTRVQLPGDDYGSVDEEMALLDRLKASVQAVPGVRTVSLADGIPLDLSGNFGRVSRADRVADAGEGERVEFTRADEDYFKTIGTSILRGRGFTARDDQHSEQVVIITEDLAETLWPEGGAVGQRLRYPTRSDPDLALTVVGTAEHVASSNASTDLPHMFVPFRQRSGGYAVLVVRGALEASALMAPIQSAILGVDPTVSRPLVVTSESLVARSMAPQRATANISAGLGVLALILSAIGVYGVVAFAVATRTREIGVRMALGASRRQVLREVFAGGVRLAVPGLAVGGLLAAAMAVIMRSMLLGLSPIDPISFGLAGGVLLLVVVLASLVPARRAASLDPMAALRHE